jgi:hypothetical protein
MSRSCRICTAPNRVKIDAALLSGVTDRAVARRFKIPHSSVQRHRVNHVLPPKPSDGVFDIHRVRQQYQHEQRVRRVSRQEPEHQIIHPGVASSGRDEPPSSVLASLSLVAQAGKLAEIEGRLSRAAARAEEAGAVNTLTNLTTAQLRAIETGSKLARECRVLRYFPAARCCS